MVINSDVVRLAAEDKFQGLDAIEGVRKFEERIAWGVIDLVLERRIRGIVRVGDREDRGWLDCLRHNCE